MPSYSPREPLPFPYRFPIVLFHHESAHHLLAALAEHHVVGAGGEARGVDGVGDAAVHARQLAVVDHATHHVDDGHAVAIAGGEVDFDAGLAGGGVGIELAEVALHLHALDALGGVVFGAPAAAEGEGDALHRHGGGVEVEVGAVHLRSIYIGEGVVAPLAGGHRLGDGLAVVAGGADVVFHGVLRHSGHDSGHAAAEAVAVGGEFHGVPLLAARLAPFQLRAGDAAAVGDDGADGDALHLARRHGVVQVAVQDADGVVGGDLLGDAVDGAAAAVEFAHVDAVERVARIGLLDEFDVGAVPFGGGHAVGTHGREAGLDDEVVDEGVVGVGAGVVVVVFALAAEVGAVVARGEGQGGHGAVVGAEEGGVGGEAVNVLLSRAVVGPAAVGLGHHGEDEAVLVPHVGVEVDVACAAVILVGGEDVGGALADEVAQGLFDLRATEWGDLLVGDAVDVLSVPNDLSVAVAVGGVDVVAGGHHAGSVDQAVAAFPLDVRVVVGDALLPADDGGKRVVEGAAGVVGEVEHGEAVLLAVVEADGAAVAVPEGVAWADEELHVVAAQAHAGQGVAHGGGVGGLLNAHPGLGAAHLDGIHEVEEHLAEVAAGVHRGAVGAHALFFPFAAGHVVPVVLRHAADQRVGIPVASALRGGGGVFVEGGYDDGLHLFPLAGEPHAPRGHVLRCLALGGGQGAQGDAGGEVALRDVALVVPLAPLPLHLVRGLEALGRKRNGGQQSGHHENCLFHQRSVFSVFFLPLCEI